jgi:riboflavin kinase/FMN adenylyltransferase
MQPAEAGVAMSGSVRLEGVVEHGDARGRELGYPTANISLPDGEIRDGVWAGTVRLGSEGQGQTYAAAVSVGRRPTYYRKGARLLEAHLLDYSGDLNGQIVQVTLHAFLRGQRRFHGTEELAAQICDDVACVRSWTAATGREIKGARELAGKPQALQQAVRPLATPSSPPQRRLPVPPLPSRPPEAT